MFDNRRIISILFFFLPGAFDLLGQTPIDSSKTKDPLRIVTFSENNFEYGNNALQDSVNYKLDSFQIVHPFLLSTGNLGGPGKSLTFQNSPVEAFSARSDAFGYFGFNRYNRKFYSTNQPYTLLRYFVGQRREQYVDVIHTRNFGENLNFSFEFMRIRSEGFYRRQNTSNTSVRSNLWYKSPRKRYAFMADVYWTGANVAENGGIANDSSFEFSNQIDRQVVAVNLENAGTIQQKRGLWTKHTFGFGKITDTLTVDSAHVYKVITPAWGISVVSELFDEKYSYNDGFPLSVFYDVVYRDTLTTSDSTHLWKVNNSVRLERFNQYGTKKINGYVGVRHEAGEYFNDTIYTHFQNLYLENYFRWSNMADNSIYCDFDWWYVLSGLNKGDYRYALNFNSRIARSDVYAAAGAKMGSITPSYLFMHYSGNHQLWTNSLASTATQSVFVQISRNGKGWLRSVSAIQDLRVVSGFVYFDSTFLPQQTQNAIRISATTVQVKLSLGWFQSASICTWQVVNNDAIVRIPEWTVQHSMYANLHLFKRALQLQVGIDAIWFSQFTSEAYMPTVAQFYLQNSRSLGNYVYLSPWVSFRVRPVLVFVKAEHVNAGLMGRKYFMFDGYPHNDFALKIGISWLFND